MAQIKIAENVNSKNQIIGSVPIGTIVPTIISTVPTGWLECDGSEVAIGSSGSTYYALSQQLGTTYGALTNGSGAAGSTHFRLPNLKSSYLIAKVSTDNINSGGSNNHQHLVTAAATSSNGGNTHYHNIGQTNYGGENWIHAHYGASNVGANGTNPPNANKTGTGGTGQAGGAAHTHSTHADGVEYMNYNVGNYHDIASLGISSSGASTHSHTSSAAGSNSISANSATTTSFPQSYVVRYLIKV